MVLVRPVLAMCQRHLSLELLIALVPKHKEGKGLRLLVAALVDEVLAPGIQMLERLVRGDVVHEDAPVRPPIKSRAQGLVALLPGRVPHLKSHSVHFSVLLDLYLFAEEIAAYRWFVRLGNLLANVILDNRCLPDTRSI